MIERLDPSDYSDETIMILTNLRGDSKSLKGTIRLDFERGNRSTMLIHLMYSYMDDLCSKIYNHAKHSSSEWEKVFNFVFDNVLELGQEYWVMETFDLSRSEVFSTPNIYKERIYQLEKSLNRSGDDIDNSIGLSNLRTMKRILDSFIKIIPLNKYF